MIKGYRVLHVQIPEQLHKRLTAGKKNRGLTVEQAVTEAIQQWIEGLSNFS